MEAIVAAPQIKRPALLGALALMTAAAALAACLSLVGIASALTAPIGKTDTIIAKVIFD